jgi:hypothetical protein
MRVPFSAVFQTNANGSVSPKTNVTIGGVTMSPGVSFSKGVSFSGIDIAQYVGHDLEVIYQGTNVIVKSIY